MVAAIGVVLALAVDYLPANGLVTDRQDRSPASVDNLRAMSFTMVDHEGATVTPRALVGRPTMVFFGFTYCPEVCPTTLNDISGWIEDLGSAAENLNTVFITVDPTRDTVATISEYVSAFHPRIRGWRGSAANLKRAAQAFRVTYARMPLDGANYTMDHTASVFLFDQNGRFKSTVDFHEDRRVAVQKIKRILETR